MPRELCTLGWGADPAGQTDDDESLPTEAQASGGDPQDPYLSATCQRVRV